MSKRIVCFLLVLAFTLVSFMVSNAQDDAPYDGVWISSELGMVIEVKDNVATAFETGCTPSFEVILEGDTFTLDEDTYSLTIEEDTLVLLANGIPLIFQRAESRESACAALAPLTVFSAEDVMAWAEREVSTVFPYIEYHPSPTDFRRGAMTPPIPTYDPTSDELWQVDLRGYDLSTLDLRDSLGNLLYADFDDRTVWPPADRLPQDFDWQRIMELGKDPGLGVRDLHDQGITGKGVGIAIIDQILLVDHQEYAGQLRWYEETPDLITLPEGLLRSATMHGAAVSSIAVGQTVGVAPEADLYYIATDRGGSEEDDSSYYAAIIRRILNINQQLPEDRKIRVISISDGWNETDKGYAEVVSAVEEAQAANVLVLSANMALDAPSFKYYGLGRAPLSDPAVVESYEPCLWWTARPPLPQFLSDLLLVPMDSRTTASPTGNADYVFYRGGGQSWTIPYVAGMYALAVQVDPAMTPEQFWSLALQTGQTLDWEYNGETISLDSILDPVALIAEVQRQ